MEDFEYWLTVVGGLAFGLVVGWTTYRTLRRHNTGLSDIATVIGAVGGAAVTALFPGASGAFGAYCVGLALGFFGYVIAALNTPPSVNPPEPVLGGGEGGGGVDPTVPRIPGRT